MRRQDDEREARDEIARQLSGLIERPHLSPGDAKVREVPVRHERSQQHDDADRGEEPDLARLQEPEIGALGKLSEHAHRQNDAKNVVDREEPATADRCRVAGEEIVGEKEKNSDVRTGTHYHQEHRRHEQRDGSCLLVEERPETDEPAEHHQRGETDSGELASSALPGLIAVENVLRWDAHGDPSIWAWRLGQ